jgi:nucleotide-binding universal stress UspA family protein
MDVKKILYATNLNKPGFKVLEGLLGLNKFGCREIVLLLAMGKEKGMERGRLKDLASERFETWKKKLIDYGINASIKIEPENLAASVLKTIQSYQASMLVIHFDKNSDRKIFGGSILSNIIKSSNIPVLVVDKDEKALNFSSKGIFERVLLPTDWSSEYENALKYVKDCKELIDELEIVNVIFKKLTLRDLQQLMEKMINTREACSKLGISAEYHMYAGRTVEEILRAAEDYDSTIIIIGAKRRHKFKDIFLCRLAYSVMEKSPAPVMLIP